MNRPEELSAYIEALVYRMKMSEQSACDIVSLRELQAVSFLEAHPDAKMTQIAEHLQWGLSSVTAIMDRLVAKRIVERFRSDDDRRVVLVALTEEGKAIARTNREQKRALAEQMLSALDEGDQKKLMEIMRKIAERVSGEERGTE